MLEHIPAWLGHAMASVRAGHRKLVVADGRLSIGDVAIDLTSPAFAHGARLPIRFTADGEGRSPPLLWSEPPAGTVAFALIVEDPDAPAPNPLVHALVWGLPGDCRGIAEGEIVADGDGGADGRDVGRNSYLGEGWLPPDPPTGHGTHDYVFQLFALSAAPRLDASPGRSELLKALQGRVLGAGVLIGTYSRGEERAVDPRPHLSIA